MGFTKLDEDFFDSSLVAEGPIPTAVFVLLLAKAKADGVARVAAPIVGGRLKLTEEQTAAAFDLLQSPDPHSRSLEHEGRRIERVDGGWLILNYQKRRQAGIREAVQEYDRERKRLKAEAIPEDSGTFPEYSASSSASTSASEEEKGGVGGGDRESTQTRAAVEMVFAHWQTVMGKGKAKLTPERRRRIVARIREGYTVDDLRAAVDGCKASAWHQGANGDGKVFDDLELICRSGKHVERFIAAAASPGPRSANAAVIAGYRTIAEEQGQ